MASEVKTNKISPATSTTVTLGDASDLFQLPASAEIDIASGATLDVNGTIDVTGATVTGLSAGKIGQVLQAYKTDAYTLSTASTWTAITDLSLTITPSAATSKVLVMANIFHSSDASGGSLMFRFVRTSTAIGIADAVGTPRLQTSFGSYIGDHSTTAEVATDMSGNTFLDSPSTTSATTYTIEGYIAGSTQYVNRSIRDTDLAGYDPRSCSSFTLMEVLV